jgi:hypothetical protein
MFPVGQPTLGKLIIFSVSKTRQRGVKKTWHVIEKVSNTIYHIMKIFISNNWRLLTGASQKNVHFFYFLLNFNWQC